MLGSVWEEAKLHEHPNNYIDSLIDMYSFTWCSVANANKLPSGATKLLWENLVRGGYMALVDGFSKIPFCSTEGRSLMSMDLASFTSGISPRSVQEALEAHSSCISPPHVIPLRGMAYVDTYIKVFYYPRPVRMYIYIFSSSRICLLTFSHLFISPLKCCIGRHDLD
jgi:hypothetical protein